MFLRNKDHINNQTFDHLVRPLKQNGLLIRVYDISILDSIYKAWNQSGLRI